MKLFIEGVLVGVLAASVVWLVVIFMVFYTPVRRRRGF